MALEKHVHPYEILVRLGPNGYQAAHVIDLERVTDGEELIAERELPAQPISIQRAGEILGEASVQLLEQIDGLRADLAAAEQRAAAAEAEAAAAVQRAVDAESALESASSVAAPAEEVSPA